MMADDRKMGLGSDIAVHCRLGYKILPAESIGADSLNGSGAAEIGQAA